MPIQTVCSSCSVNIQVKDELIGKTIRCPKCNQVLRLPEKSNDLAATGEWQESSPEITWSRNSPAAGYVGIQSTSESNGQVSQTPADHEPVIQAIGRYQVDKLLGTGRP